MIIPFSAGKRSCIGQNMAMLQLRTITAFFIRYFDFELVEEPVKEYFITLKPASMMMKVRKLY
jgi:cytochrome P450